MNIFSYLAQTPSSGAGAGRSLLPYETLSGANYPGYYGYYVSPHGRSPPVYTSARAPAAQVTSLAPFLPRPPPSQSHAGLYPSAGYSAGPSLRAGPKSGSKHPQFLLLHLDTRNILQPSSVPPQACRGRTARTWRGCTRWRRMQCRSPQPPAANTPASHTGGQNDTY